jgi:hypothetical protein
MIDGRTVVLTDVDRRKPGVHRVTMHAMDPTLNQNTVKNGQANLWCRSGKADRSQAQMLAAKSQAPKIRLVVSYGPGHPQRQPDNRTLP